MPTGDNEQVARSVAASVGIIDVRASLVLDDKVKVLDELAQENQLVATVGDRVNDAPAMARATLGIAMGGAGTDLALETAAVALMADDPSRLPFANALNGAVHTRHPAEPVGRPLGRGVAGSSPGVRHG